MKQLKNQGKNREFGSLVILFIGFFWLKHGLNHASFSLSGFIFLSLLLVCTIWAPQILNLPRQIWIKIGDRIGSVTQPIILALLYFGIFTPIGFWRRRQNKSRILNQTENRNTCWIKSVDTSTHPTRMRKQY